jgi:hypothetical protein
MICGQSGRNFVIAATRVCRDDTKPCIGGRLLVSITEMHIWLLEWV